MLSRNQKKILRNPNNVVKKSKKCCQDIKRNWKFFPNKSKKCHQLIQKLSPINPKKLSTYPKKSLRNPKENYTCLFNIYTNIFVCSIYISTINKVGAVMKLHCCPGSTCSFVGSSFACVAERFLSIFSFLYMIYMSCIPCIYYTFSFVWSVAERFLSIFFTVYEIYIMYTMYVSYI